MSHILDAKQARKVIAATDLTRLRYCLSKEGSKCTSQRDLLNELHALQERFKALEVFALVRK